MFETGHEIVVADCPGCQNEVNVNKVWTKGGVNDYGGYVLQCDKCSKKFHLYLGRDIMESKVVKGAKVLGTYDRDNEDEKTALFAKHGLTE